MTIHSRNFISRGYRLYTQAADALKSPFLLAVRLYWGWQLMQSGWGKLHNLAGGPKYHERKKYLKHLLAAHSFTMSVHDSHARA